MLTELRPEKVRFRSLDDQILAYQTAGKNPRCAKSLARRQGIVETGGPIDLLQVHYSRTAETLSRYRELLLRGRENGNSPKNDSFQP